jgi:hypothetical protein
MTKPYAWIFDIDGTVADITHRAHLIEKSADRPTIDWDDFFKDMHLDSLFPWAKDLVDICRLREYNILFVTGRSEKYRERTEQWFFDKLRLYPPQYQMFMRETDNYIQDDLMKEDILKNRILPHFDVGVVVEDRRRVVDMYRRNGLRVLHVEDGNY